MTVPDTNGDVREAGAGQDARAILRLGFFVDAVFAVSMVFLITQIRVPDPAVPADELHDALGDAVESMFGFGLSFLTLGLFWIDSQRAFDHLRARDDGLLWGTIAFLICIAFLPYPASLLGNHLDAPIAVIFFAGSVLVTGLAWSGLWWYASGTSGRLASTEERTRQLLLWKGLSTPLIMLASIPFTWVVFDVGGGGLSLATVLWIVTVPSARLLLTRRYKPPST